MKKAIFTLAVILAGITSSFAQFEQGRMLVGGTVGFSSTTSKSESGSNSITWGNTTEISLAPQFGYFVIDNLAIGAGLDVSLSSFKPDDDDNDSEYSATGVQFQPFVRYYLPAKVFFQGNFGLGSAKYEETYLGDTDEEKYGLSSWSLAAGYAIMLNDNVAIEPMLGYGSTTTKYKDSDPEEKDIDSGLFIRVGIQVYLGGGN